MESHFSINIARMKKLTRFGSSSEGYWHYFRVEIPQSEPAHMREVLATLRLAYPAPTFRVEVSEWEARGRQLDI